MNGITRLITGLLLVSSAPVSVNAASGEFSGWINGQYRHYFDTSESVDEKSYPSAAILLNYNLSLGDKDEITSSFFGRIDNVDESRDHVDIRELLWRHHGENYEFLGGIGQASWGVNEIFKIVDIINQRDQAELPFSRKLGQPMASVSFYWGEDLIELYTLYDVRDAWYPGEEGRLRFPLRVEPDEAIYDYGKNGRWELAARWKTRWGAADISVSHFYGMMRSPYFVYTFDFNDPYLKPVYEKINQTSIDIIYPWNEVLLKLEATHREGSTIPYNSVAAGFEYTMGSLFGSKYDLSWYVEAIWDSRDKVDGSPFDHDVGVAARLAFNDTRDSNLILGIVADYEYSEGFGYFTFLSNLSAEWSINVTGQYFVANEPRLDPRNFEAYEVFTEAVRNENYPLPDEVIDNVLRTFEGTNLNRTQYDIMITRLREIQAGNGQQYFNTLDYNSVPQILFDLVRVSDNTQKLNLVERDAYVQLDIYYHF